jgi:hypothetical protein
MNLPYCRVAALAMVFGVAAAAQTDRERALLSRIEAPEPRLTQVEGRLAAQPTPAPVVPAVAAPAALETRLTQVESRLSPPSPRRRR